MKVAIVVLALVASATSSWACGNAYTKCCVTECYAGTCTTKCN
jgi:hypothetical protein